MLQDLVYLEHGAHVVVVSLQVEGELLLCEVVVPHHGRHHVLVVLLDHDRALQHLLTLQDEL
jgi:hypothetical protein